MIHRKARRRLRDLSRQSHDCAAGRVAGHLYVIRIAGGKNRYCTFFPAKTTIKGYVRLGGVGSNAPQ
jgi:hypothetical protein